MFPEFGACRGVGSMNLSPLEHPRPIPVKQHNRSRPHVREFNTTTRALIRWVRKLDRAAEEIADAFIAAVMDEAKR